MEVELQQAVNEQGTRISEHAFPPGYRFGHGCK